MVSSPFDPSSGIVADGAVVPSLYSYMAYGSGLLGMVGAVLFIFTYIVARDLRTESRELLFWLSLCDLGQGLRFVTIDLDQYSRGWCVAQSVWGLWVATASFWWTAAISIYVFVSLRLPNCVFPRWGIWMFHAVAWGYPTAFAVVNALHSDDSVASPLDEPRMLPWCYMNQHWWLWWRVLGFTVPLFTSWLVTFTMYFSSRRLLEKVELIPRQAEHYVVDARSALREMHTKFTLIPLVFLLLRVWDAVQNAYMLLWGIDATPFPVWYQLLEIFGDATQGLFNFVIFVLLTPAMYSKFMGRDAELECSPLKTGIPAYVNYGKG